MEVEKVRTRKKNRKSTFKDKIIEILQFSSVGKHNSGLYFKGKVLQSSWIGGILTILTAAVIMFVSIKTLISVVNQDVIDFTIKTESLRY